MAPLRFRAWFPNLKVMGFLNFPVAKDSDFVQWAGLKIMQSTGLKDLNGKEIYEGDIYLLLSQKKLCKTEAARRRCAKVVEWNEKTAGYNLSTDQCEVTGNIFENPELML